MKVQVVGKSLKYGIRRYYDGDPIEMSPKHARLFMALGRVFIPKAPRPDIPASPSTDVAVVATDLQAEQAEAEGLESRPRRRYSRRDMRSEP